jgi:DNA-binding YbaB/EbfC family protein
MNMKMNKMMKDLQRMQAQMQQDIEALDVEGTAGGGVVTARMNGRKQLLSLKLSPEAVTPGDVEMMEDLIVAAVNEAGRKTDQEVERITTGLTAGLKLPGLS